MKLRFFYLSFFCFFSLGSWSQSTNSKILNFDQVIFNVGTHTEFFNNVQIDASGGEKKFELTPTIGLGLNYLWEKQWSFLPEINWVLPQNAGEYRIIKNIFILRGDVGFMTSDWFRFRLGTSLFWLNQHGRGGTTQINNGNSVSTFYYPEFNRSSLNNTLDFGAELLFKELALRLQTYTYALFNKDRRQLSYTLFVSYYWDQ